MMKYVDDVNLVVTALPLGTRWDGKKFSQSEAWLKEDRLLNRTKEHVTMNALRDTADSITTFLKFTSDIPENHANNKVPMLDIQVWVHHHQDPTMADTLMWSFYEKPTASSTVTACQLSVQLEVQVGHVGDGGIQGDSGTPPGSWR